MVGRTNAYNILWWAELLPMLRATALNDQSIPTLDVSHVQVSFS